MEFMNKIVFFTKPVPLSVSSIRKILCEKGELEMFDKYRLSVIKGFQEFEYQRTRISIRLKFFLAIAFRVCVDFI